MKNRLHTILIFLYPVFFYGQNIDKVELDYLQIPTVFHIVSSNELNNNEKLQIENQIKYMILSINDRLKVIDKNKIESGFDSVATIPKIELLLPECNIENKSIEPVSWHKIPNYYFRDFIPFIDDISLNQFGTLDKNHFLNIWIIDILGSDNDGANIAGYVPKKQLNDGIVLDIDDFSFMVQDPFIVIHELGHYLGLDHTWGKTGVTSNLHNCFDDDGINDTPKQKAPHIRGLYEYIQDSCDGKGKTNHQNFMDYSYDTGMFTEDQVEVMRNNLKTKRKGLLWKPNCSNSNKSILSNTKQRDKLGAPFNFNLRLRHNTNIDLKLKDLFERELGILYNEHNLEKLGLKIIGTDTFRDMLTNKKVNQGYIYKYLDIDKAKQIIASEDDILRKKKQKVFFNTKTGISSGDVAFLSHLNEIEKEAFKNATSGNLLILSQNPNIEFEFYADGKQISIAEMSATESAKVYNIQSGSYRIICRLKTFRLGIDDKAKPYNKIIADLTFEHLKRKDNKQTILLIRGNDDNSIYQVFER
ncbi:MAG: M43 family zinc metalloprotease [Flavobacteriales bacterium]|nr:M43 family zinc metalloprotease [Flavobacteriales bacterium]